MLKPVLAIAAVLAIACAADARAAGPARQVTSSYNLDLVPSPDGRREVIITIVGGREQLFLREAGQPRWTQLTTDDADHEDPAWSPDGRRLAFVLTDGESRVVQVMNADGSGRRAVTPASVRAIHPSWTPDGARLLYSTDDDLRPPEKNESEIFEIDVASGDIRTLISGGVNTFPVMSPDGRRIAFRRIVGDGNSEVFIADRDGSNVRNLTAHPAFEGWPQWSPDGLHIAFAANRNGADYQIFVMRSDGGDVRLVADTRGRATSPKWAPDGASIYFTNCRRPEDVAGCEIFNAPLPRTGD